MNAVLAIELELVEPVLLTSGDSMRQLHPSQVRRVAIRLSAPGEANAPPLRLEATLEEDRLGVADLVDFARRVQPEGTVVVAWYQGRSEGFLI